jgi:small nuclear ribonucleoprotein (snRNP)-like protein
LLVKRAVVETAVDQSCNIFLDQLEVLEVKRATVESPDDTVAWSVLMGVDQSCKRFLDQLEVLEVNKAVVESPEETCACRELIGVDQFCKRFA